MNTSIVIKHGYRAKISHTYIMGTVKQINIKNRIYYFYNNIIDLETFISNLLKIDKKSNKDIGIYNIGYITIEKIDDCKKIYSVNCLYLRINHASGYIEQINGNKYLIFDSKDGNKELLKKYNDVLTKPGVKLKKSVMMSMIMKKIT